MPLPDENDDDPLDLEAVDLEISINQKREELKEIAGEDGVIFGGPNEGDDDWDPHMEDAFLSHILAFENAEFTTRYEFLTKNGMVIPPPDELDDAYLPAKLWEIFNELGKHRHWFYNTDHLSDRELYGELWESGLIQGDVTFLNDGGNWNHDFIGSGSEEDIDLWLRFYADDREREDWLKQYPGDPMPPKEMPPYDRDRFLPVREPGT